MLSKAIMSRFFFAFFSLVLFGSSVYSSGGGGSCSAIYSTTVKNLDIPYDPAQIFKVNKKYQIQLRDSSNVSQMQLLQIYSENGEPRFEFIEKGTKAIYKLAPDEIWDARLTGWRVPQFSEVIDFFKRQLMGLFVTIDQQHSSLRAQLPIFPYAETSRLNVGSLSPFTDRALAQKIADNYTAYDQHYEALGFRIPDFTKVHILTQQWIPRSSSQFFPSSLISRKYCLKHTITLSPWNHDMAFVSDPFVHLHERAHSILFATYDSKSRVSNDIYLQEGLADFFAAQDLGIPVPENIKPEFSRSLADRSSKGVRLRSLLDLTGEPHNDGVFLSSVLWKIRERIGAQRMGEILISLVDGFNKYEIDSEKVPAPKTHLEIRKFEETLAILKRASQDLPEAKVISEVLSNEAVGLSMDITHLKTIEASLKETNGPNRRQGVRMGEILVGTINSTLGFLFDSAVVLTLVPALF